MDQTSCLKPVVFLFAVGLAPLAVLATPNPPGCGADDLYAELEQNLLEFEHRLASQRNRDQRPVTFGAELLSANSHRGEELLPPKSFWGNLLYLDRLQALGVKGVTIKIGYPILLPDYPRSSEYLDFYQALAVEIRLRGLKLHIKTGPTFQQEEFSNLVVSYDNLTLREYFDGRREQVHLIALELKPDYLTVGNEPSTEQSITGLAFHTVDYTHFVNDSLRDLDRDGMKVGVGAGSWDDPDYIESFARHTSVDFIDLHIYPLSNGYVDYLERAIELIDVAQSYGKKVIIGEAWLYKASKQELAAGLASPATSAPIFARDVFNTWSPLDEKFLETIVLLAKHKNLDYVSFFWTKYFFAYLDCDTATVKLTPKERLRRSDRAAWENIVANRYSGTGRTFKRVIRP
jgi:hypothetical protein